MNIRIYISLILIIFHFHALSQNHIKTKKLVKWEFGVSSGIYADLLWTIVGAPPGYSDLQRKLINWGRIDRSELKMYLNKNNAISLYHQRASWREMYGKGLDPLEVWKGVSRHNRRHHFTLNYEKLILLKNNKSISFSSGFQIQIEKKSFPYYKIDTVRNIVTISEIGARPDNSYWEDWAIPITISFSRDINTNLKIGVILNSAYTMGAGFDGISLLSNVCIPITYFKK